MRRVSVFIIALFVAVVGSGTAIAKGTLKKTTLKKIKDTGTITLGHGDSSIPFVYYDDKHKAVGYSLDICYRVVDAIKAELKMPTIAIKLHPVISTTRIPLILDGTVDLECGSASNNLERQKQVWFATTHFVSSNRFVSKKDANLKTVDDLTGKTVISTSGTTSFENATEINKDKKLGMKIIGAKVHTEAFEAVETGRAVAFFMDDILLYSLVANSKTPSEWVISADPLTVEPYGMMIPKDDVAFKKVVNDAINALYKSGEINKIYDKWFLQPTPPKGIKLNVPMSAAFKNVVANPTDSADPNDYN